MPGKKFGFFAAAAFAALVAAAFIKIERFPVNAALYGDHWISCSGVKYGMYHCKVYSKDEKKLIREKTYIYPGYYGAPAEAVLSKNIIRFEDDAIFLRGKKKLIASDIPEDSALVQSINGGVWINARQEKTSKNHYVCTVYNVKDGNIASSGLYALKKYYWDAVKKKSVYSEVKSAPKFLEFVYYGGVGITLKNKVVLMPAGWIEYPEGARSGLRVEYDEAGNEKKREEY